MTEEIKNETGWEVPKIKPVVETFADDMARAIEHAEGGMVKKIIEEQEEKEDQDQNLSIESKKNKIFIFIGLVLILLTFGIFIGIYFLRNTVLTSTVAPKFVPVIFLDKTDVVDITGFNKENLVSAIATQINSTEIKQGEVEGIYFSNNKKPVGLREFIKLINGNLPLDDSIAFLSDNFLVGINKIGENKPASADKNLFFLLQDRSMSDIFPAMTAWENKMFLDLHGFFNIPLNADTNYLLTKDFEDEIVGNKNARMLKDKDGNIVLMYVYTTDTSIVVANSEDTVKEVINRLASSQVKK